jgi:hypothetical protein
MGMGLGDIAARQKRKGGSRTYTNDDLGGGGSGKGAEFYAGKKGKSPSFGNDDLDMLEASDSDREAWGESKGIDTRPPKGMRGFTARHAAKALSKSK